MHPDYEKYTYDRRGGEALRFRVPADVRTELESIVQAEGGTLTDLMLEGVWRVIEVRRNDPEFQAKSQQTQDLQAQIEEIRANLHNR